MVENFWCLFVVVCVDRDVMDLYYTDMTRSVLYKMDLNGEGPKRRDQLGCYCYSQGRGLEIKQ